MNSRKITTVSDLHTAWQEIREDTRQGASELLRQALKALADYLVQAGPMADDFDLDSLLEELAVLRQDMVGFANSARLLKRAEADDVYDSLQGLRRYLDQAPDKIGKTAVEILSGASMTIMTNSRSSATESALLALAEAGRLDRVLQMESRPAFEGRDNANKLLSAGIQVTVLPDAAMGCWLEQADAVVVGADAIQESGDFIGKIGCWPLACLAWRKSIPFYVAAERLKITSSLPALETVNQRFTGTLLDWGEGSGRLTLSHIIFELIPGELIAGFLTESGLLLPPLTKL